MNYKFKCPECENDMIEEVLEGVTQISLVTHIELDQYREPAIDYGKSTTHNGDVDSCRYQCSECGHGLSIEDLGTLAESDVV